MLGILSCTKSMLDNTQGWRVLNDLYTKKLHEIGKLIQKKVIRPLNRNRHKKIYQMIHLLFFNLTFDGVFYPNI